MGKVWNSREGSSFNDLLFFGIESKEVAIWQKFRYYLYLRLNNTILTSI